ncbi:MAG: VWA domain-containing protein [Rhodospirillaceae bacterium]|nr:VWA domain-containing protein [Rhodospirillaceae bacterium]
MPPPDKPSANTPAHRPVGGNVAAFLKQVASSPVPVVTGQRGRLMFAMDATASRAPTWSQAISIQADMFKEAATAGGLDVQLVYYRGLMEFDASPWTADANRMVELMRRVQFLSGQTQIERILNHTAEETRRKKVNAVVFIGDAVEEMADLVEAAAGKLGVLGVPVFIFHEGGGEPAAGVFKRIAAMTRGAYASFDASSPQKLRDLLKAVAVYAAGGARALEDFGKRTGGDVLRLTTQIKG